MFDYTTTLPMGQESITLTLQVNPSTTNTSILLAYNAEPPDWYRSRTLLAAVSKPVASGSANVIALYPGTTTVITVRTSPTPLPLRAMHRYSCPCAATLRTWRTNMQTCGTARSDVPGGHSYLWLRRGGVGCARFRCRPPLQGG